MKFHDFSPFYRSGEGIRSKVSGDRLIDNPAVSDAQGGSGASFKFDGTDDYVEVGDDANLDMGTNDFSVEGWVRPNAASESYENVYCKRDTGAPLAGYELVIYNGLAKGIIIDTNSNQEITGTSDLRDGNWHHVCATFDRTSTSYVYVNGVQEGSAPITDESLSVDNSISAFIGKGRGAFGYLDGSIAQVRVHNRALTADEVRASYNGQAVAYEYVGGSQDIVIPGDFTGDLDGWNAGNSWNSQTNPSNNMVLLATGPDAYCRTAITLVEGKKYRCTYTASSTAGTPQFSYYSDSLQAFAATSGSSTITDGTNSFEFIYPTASTNGYFYITSVATSDGVTLDDVSVVQIGCVAEYLPSGINGNTDGTNPSWVDTSGNNLHGTTSTATAVNHEVGALTMVDNIIMADGKGIDFSATADTVATGAARTSELLSDYEEGTWTAALTGCSATITDDTGYYTKIGNRVFFQWYSAAITITSSTGNATITGLPFQSNDNARSNSTFDYQFGTAVDGGSTGGYVGVNDNELFFMDTNSSSNASFVDGTKFITISGHYFV